MTGFSHSGHKFLIRWTDPDHHITVIVQATLMAGEAHVLKTVIEQYPRRD